MFNGQLWSLEVDAVTLAYLAGLFDGEGCVGWANSYKHKRSTLRVSVVNTNRDLCEAFQRVFGGSVCLSYPAGYRPNWAAAYQWMLTGEAIHAFREALTPYLRQKVVPVNIRRKWSDVPEQKPKYQRRRAKQVAQ